MLHCQLLPSRLKTAKSLEVDRDRMRKRKRVMGIGREGKREEETVRERKRGEERGRERKIESKLNLTSSEGGWCCSEHSGQ